jgi:hypothetical protein
MTMIYCLKFAGVMFSMILADISWTYYFMKVEERSSLSASMWSSLIIIFGMFTTMNYVDDRSEGYYIRKNWEYIVSEGDKNVFEEDNEDKWEDGEE